MKTLLFVALLFLLGCSSRNDELARTNLETILKDDLEVIISDVDSSILLENPHYSVEKFDYYEKSLYSYNAVVYFYFLKDESFCVERKFRYHLKQGKWERYFNEYKKIQK